MRTLGALLLFATCIAAVFAGPPRILSARTAIHTVHAFTVNPATVQSSKSSGGSPTGQALSATYRTDQLAGIGGVNEFLEQPVGLGTPGLGSKSGPGRDEVMDQLYAGTPQGKAFSKLMEFERQDQMRKMGIDAATAKRIEVSQSTHAASAVTSGDSYTALTFAVTFDQPLFVYENDTSLRRDEDEETAAPVMKLLRDMQSGLCLQGIIRLSCGNEVFDSFPDGSSRSQSPHSYLPTTLTPLYGRHHLTSLSWLFHAAISGVSPLDSPETVLPPANEFRAILLLEYTENKIHHRVRSLDQIHPPAPVQHRVRAHTVAAEDTENKPAANTDSNVNHDNDWLFSESFDDEADFVAFLQTDDEEIEVVSPEDEQQQCSLQFLSYPKQAAESFLPPLNQSMCGSVPERGLFNYEKATVRDSVSVDVAGARKVSSAPSVPGTTHWKAEQSSSSSPSSTPTARSPIRAIDFTAGSPDGASLYNFYSADARPRDPSGSPVFRYRTSQSFRDSEEYRPIELTDAEPEESGWVPHNAIPSKNSTSSSSRSARTSAAAFVETGSSAVALTPQQMDDSEQLFEFLQVISFIQNAEQVGAHQVLELISDVFVILVVPAATYVAAAIAKDLIMDAIMPLVKETVISPLIEPVINAMLPAAFIETGQKIVRDAVKNIGAPLVVHGHRAAVNASASGVLKEATGSAILLESLRKSTQSNFKSRQASVAAKLKHSRDQTIASLRFADQRNSKNRIYSNLDLFGMSKKWRPKEFLLPRDRVSLPAASPSPSTASDVPGWSLLEIDSHLVSEHRTKLRSRFKARQLPMGSLPSKASTTTASSESAKSDGEDSNPYVSGAVPDSLGGGQMSMHAINTMTAQMQAASPGMARLINAMYSTKPEEQRELMPPGYDWKPTLKRTPEEIKHEESLEAKEHASEASSGNLPLYRFAEGRAGAVGKAAARSKLDKPPKGPKPKKKTSSQFDESGRFPESKFSGTTLDDSSQEITHGTAVQVFNSLALALPDNVRHGVNRTVTRECSRDIITQLTTSLTMSISSLLTVQLPRAVIHMVTHYVTRPLIPMLTHSLGTSVTHAITRKTQDDYFCYFCLQSEAHIFCPSCRDAMHTEMSIDYYVGYYAAYYSKYYETFYGELYADKITDDYINGHPWGPEIGPG